MNFTLFFLAVVLVWVVLTLLAVGLGACKKKGETRARVVPL
jgi:hypothetical protein